MRRQPHVRAWFSCWGGGSYGQVSAPALPGKGSLLRFQPSSIFP
jgi:hypothetical protein